MCIIGMETVYAHVCNNNKVKENYFHKIFTNWLSDDSDKLKI